MEYKLTNKSSDTARKMMRAGFGLLSATALVFLYFVMIAAFVSVINTNPPLKSKQIEEIPLVAPSEASPQPTHAEAWPVFGLGAE